MTKVEQAVTIYKEEVANTKDAKAVRAACIERFKSELGMTQSGATTYYHNSKKKAEGGIVKSYYKGKETMDPGSDNPCSKVVYSIVDINNGVVESTESGYDLKLLKSQAKGRPVVRGLPDLDKPLKLKKV